MTMKRSILSILAFAFTLALAAEASAGGVTTSKIAEFGMIPSSNIAWVRVVGPVTTPALCASDGYFSVNISTDIGKSVFKVLLVAQVQNLPLTIYGTGQCAQSAGSEDILYIWYNPPTI
jgi:hypothetical protein